MMKDTLERTREPNLNMKGFLQNAYIRPVFKGEDDSENDAPAQEFLKEPAVVLTKRTSRRNTPMPSRYSGSSSSFPVLVERENGRGDDECGCDDVVFAVRRSHRTSLFSLHSSPTLSLVPQALHHLLNPKIAQNFNLSKMTDTVVPRPIVHELLNQNNYEEWSLRVETYLLAKGLWEVVEATTEPPKREDGEIGFQAWRQSNAEALHSIQVSCGADTFSFIRGTRRAKIAWDILAEKLKPAEASQATGTASSAGHEDNHVNQTLWDLVDKKEWDAAMELLKRHPKAVTARIWGGGTMLHWAVFLKKVDIAKALVHLMTPEDLEIQDDGGLTALHRVIISIPESVEVAKCMVEKNKKLLSIVLPRGKTIPLLAGKITPLIQAHNLSHEEGEKMAQYLYSITPHETLNDSDCAMLIIQGLALKRFGIAWDLIQRRQELVIAKYFYGITPLNELAGMGFAFLSGSSLNFWERWIYDG
ncbi:hypothetical protein C1H46_037038 [Malus baccata]|uniref:DUF4219 domain-containing protein n=1 Tax=Malus baccata TaxID=106549 RepID=A0A540KT81_MALBA|nr:hypothetical protein C1H46_037038 [Malus baccata]